MISCQNLNNPNLKKNSYKRKNLTYKHKRLIVFDYEDLLVIGVLFDLNLKGILGLGDLREIFEILDEK